MPFFVLNDMMLICDNFHNTLIGFFEDKFRSRFRNRKFYVPKWKKKRIFAYQNYTDIIWKNM